MRVALIHPFLFRYARGIERFTFNLSNALSARGVEVHLLTWQWQDKVQIDLLRECIQVHVMPTSRYYAAQAVIPFYAWHLARQKYDWVWIYFAGYGEAQALTLSRHQRFGIVLHYPLAQVPHRYREFQKYGLARRAAQIVSVTQYVAQGADVFFGRQSAVIYYGVETERFKPDPRRRQTLRKSLQIEADAPLLVTAAALEERKGVQWILRALPQVIAKYPSVTYLVLGDGEYLDALKTIAAELNLTQHVRFLGAQSDITPFYQAADLSLILARGEASSLAALESLACQLPVIASQQPPFDELIRAEYGILVDEQAPAQVGSAIISLLDSPDVRQRMGATGRRHIIENFSWNRAAQKYIELMERERR